MFEWRVTLVASLFLLHVLRAHLTPVDRGAPDPFEAGGLGLLSGNNRRPAGSVQVDELPGTQVPTTPRITMRQPSHFSGTRIDSRRYDISEC